MYLYFLKYLTAQLAKAVVYANCIFTEWYPSSPTSVLDITLIYLMLRRFRECSMSLHCYAPKSTWPRMGVLVMVLCMAQIELLVLNSNI